MSERTLFLEVPVPVLGRREPPVEVRDQREAFGTISSNSDRDEIAERAFMLSKAHLIKTDPTLDGAGRHSALAELAESLGTAFVEALELAAAPVRAVETLEPRVAPVPGGAGYGFFYTVPFKSAFAQGTSLFFELICPDLPGGECQRFSLPYRHEPCEQGSRGVCFLFRAE